MRWSSQISGAVVLLVGVAFGVAAFLVPEARVRYLASCLVMLASGVSMVWLGQWINKLTKGFPEPKGLGASMKDAAAKMAMVTELLEQQARADRLTATGEDAKAQVLAVRDTGQMINFDTIIELDLLVTVGERPPYPLMEFRQVVSKLVVGRIAVGQSFSAKVSPVDPRQILLYWL